MAVLAPVYSITGWSPDKKDRMEFWMDNEFIQGMFDRGLVFKYYDAVIVSDVLRDPKAVAFRGLKRLNNTKDGLCFCGKPPFRYLGADPVFPPAGMVFTAYVLETARGHDNLVIDWDWWPEDTTNPGHPIDWRTDYEEKLWPLTN